ncbi:uncharacterized protein METZ01_LOCUS393935, partial [marine metagenome]
MISLNDTHDPKLTSWVTSANQKSSDFPVQNLPIGIFRRTGSEEIFRGGVAIGDQILDVGQAIDAGLLEGDVASACMASSLNQLMAMKRTDWQDLRSQVSRLLRAGGPEEQA